MEIPAEQLSVLQSQAQSGDETAKSLLADYGQSGEPAKQPTDPNPSENGAAEPAQEGEATPPESQATEVDKSRGRNGKEEKKPTKLDTIRELRRKKRELEALSDRREQEWQKKIAELEAKVNSLQPNGQKTNSEEDALTELLSKPTDFLSQREKRLLEQVEKLMDQRLQTLPQLLGRTNEKAEASKLLKGIEGLDLENDEDALLDLLSEYGLEEDDVYEMAENKPLKFARMVQRVWAKKNDLPPETLAAKSAATSTASGSKPNLGKPMTLKDLNDRYAVAARQGNQAEMDRIHAEMESLAAKQ